MKKIGALVGLLVFGGLFYLFASKNSEGVAALLAVDSYYVGVLSVLVVFCIFLAGLKTKVMLKVFGVDIGHVESFGISATNTLHNYLLAKSGILTRGLYFRSRHALPISEYVSIVGATYIIGFLFQGVLGTVLVLSHWVLTGVMSVPLLVIFLFMVAGGVFAFFVPDLSRINRWNWGLVRKVNRAIGGWKKIRKLYGVLIAVGMIDVVFTVANAARLYVSFEAIGQVPSIWSALVLSSLYTFILLVSFTPAGLGVRQTVLGFASEFAGTGLESGVYASLLDHSVGIVWVGVFGVVFTLYFSLKMGSRKNAGVQNVSDEVSGSVRPDHVRKESE